ncbi:hypothetical protein N8666_00370 [bacterium]|nr:hypothetical protein [bacterium]
MFNTGNNKATDQEMERLLELSTDPEFLSQLDSFKENKAAEIKVEYKDKITALENEIQNIRAELNAKLSALGVNIEKSPKRRSSKNNTRRTKEATQELLTRVKDLIRQHPGITAGEISAQINETASPLLSRLKSEGHVRPTGKGRGTTWNLA